MTLAAADRLLRERIVGAQQVPGAVVLARRGRELLFHEAYGFRQNIPETLPMTRDTLFDLASVTKPIVCGLLAMRMWQQGRVRLEDWPLGRLGRASDPLKDRITVQQLLSNRSGLPAWRAYFQAYAPEACPVAAQKILEQILVEPLEAPPGEREIYSDLGFMILGWFLESIGQDRLDELFRQEISMPLSLGRTGYRRSGEQRADEASAAEEVAATEYCNWRHRVVKGEVHDENCYLLGGVSGHAGLFATAGELDRIVVEIFRGLQDDSDLFRPGGLSAFLRRPEGSPPGTWALGWDTPSPRNSAAGRYYSANSFGHIGFTGTSLWMDLERRISVVFLTNRVHPSRDNLAIRSLRPAVHDAILGEILSGPR